MEGAALDGAAGVLAGSASPDVLYAHVNHVLAAVTGADAAWLLHLEPDQTLTELGFATVPASRWPDAGGRPLPAPALVPADVRHAFRFDRRRGCSHASVAASAELLGVTSAVTVPIRLAGRVWGLAAVARFGDEPLPRSTERRLARLVARLAPSLADAHGAQGLQRIVHERSAAKRIAELAASGLPPHGLLAAVAQEASRLMDAKPVVLARLEQEGDAAVVVAASGGAVPVQWRFPLTASPASTGALDGPAPWRLDSYPTATVEALSPDHPVRAAVAVVIRVAGVAWGVLAALSPDGPMPAGAERSLEGFAETATAAVMSAQARIDAQELADEQAALLRVAALVAQGADEQQLFEAVVAESSALLLEATILSRVEGPNRLDVLATHAGVVPVGFVLFVPEDDPGVAAEVFRTHRPARRDDYQITWSRVLTHSRGRGSSVAVPIIVDGELWGLLGTMTEGRRLPSSIVRRLQKFAELVAACIANAQARVRVQQLADEQSALRRVAELVAKGANEQEIFDAVALEASGLIDHEPANLVRMTGPWSYVLVSSCGGPGEVGMRIDVPQDDEGTSAAVIRTHRTARRDHYGDDSSNLFARDDFGLGSSVAVPIIVDHTLWGMIGSLTQGRRLPPQTERRLAQFAELVSAALANSNARAELQRLADCQAGLRRVAELVAQGGPLQDVFRATAAEASRLLGAVPSSLWRYGADDSLSLVADSCRPEDERPSVPPTTSSTSVPIVVEGRRWGVLTTGVPSGPQVPDGELWLAELAALTAAAIANASNRDELTASRARVLVTADRARQQLQRDVHDGAQQWLVQTVLTLELALASDAEDRAPLMTEALRHARRATVELRHLVHGILPASLTRDGLRTGLQALAADYPGDLHLEADVPRLPLDLETTAYFVVAEGLTNVVKHAPAARTRVAVALNDGRLSIEVVDDGPGGADPASGTGLLGLQDRVAAAGGSLRIRSAPGEGTVLRVDVPVPGVL